MSSCHKSCSWNCQALSLSDQWHFIIWYPRTVIQVTEFSLGRSQRTKLFYTCFVFLNYRNVCLGYHSKLLINTCEWHSVLGQKKYLRQYHDRVTARVLQTCAVWFSGWNDFMILSFRWEITIWSGRFVASRERDRLWRRIHDKNVLNLARMFFRWTHWQAMTQKSITLRFAIVIILEKWGLLVTGQHLSTFFVSKSSDWQMTMQCKTMSTSYCEVDIFLNSPLECKLRRSY